MSSHVGGNKLHDYDLAQPLLAPPFAPSAQMSLGKVLSLGSGLKIPAVGLG